MPSKDKLLEKLLKKPSPTNFTTRELEQLMSKCNCVKSQGGRGSGVAFMHLPTKRMLAFDYPHPGNELYRYQVKRVIDFLTDIEEI